MSVPAVAAIRLGFTPGAQCGWHWNFAWPRGRWHGARPVHLRDRLFGDDVEPELTLSMEDWGRLQSALIDASFWALEARDDRLGLDGAWWTIEGRRKEIYRCARRWSPDGAIWRLGRMFFDLAGLTHVKIY